MLLAQIIKLLKEMIFLFLIVSSSNMVLRLQGTFVSLSLIIHCHLLEDTFMYFAKSIKY